MGRTKIKTLVNFRQMGFHPRHASKPSFVAECQPVSISHCPPLSFSLSLTLSLSPSLVANIAPFFFNIRCGSVWVFNQGGVSSSSTHRKREAEDAGRLAHIGERDGVRNPQERRLARVLHGLFHHGRARSPLLLDTVPHLRVAQGKTTPTAKIHT